MLVLQSASPNKLQDASKIVDTDMKRYRFTSRREGSTRESNKSQVGIVRPTQRSQTRQTTQNAPSPKELLASTGAGMQSCNAGFSAPYIHRREGMWRWPLHTNDDPNMNSRNGTDAPWTPHTNRLGTVPSKPRRIVSDYHLAHTQLASSSSKTAEEGSKGNNTTKHNTRQISKPARTQSQSCT